MNKRFPLKKMSTPMQTVTPLVAALLLTFAPLAAQAAGPVVPDAGAILQQIQPSMPPLPSASATGLTIEQADGSKLPPSAPFLVQSIQIVGNTRVDTPTLLALVADAQGQMLTLPQLGELAARITAYYQSQGYPLARAIIPAQTIALGVVHIEVIEARYGKVSLDNTSLVNSDLLQATLAPLQSEQAIGQAEMDHALLLLSDIAGVVVNATLKPGEAVGTSDLLVETTPGPVISGNAVLDGYGNRYTGRERIGGTLSVNNPLHHGDTLSVSGLSSGSGMNYGRLAYESLLNGQGTRLGGAYSALDYTLGAPLAALNAHGTAQVSSLWAKHPLLRSRDFNLYGQIQYDELQLRDHVDASSIRTDRRLENWTLSLTGDARDALGAGGINTWSLGWTAGRAGFDDNAAQLADAATAKTQGNFSKWNASLARLQALGAQDTVYLAFSGQWSNTNLDSSQKMSVGGPYTVRAYDMGAVSGDSGYFVSAEYRHDLGQAGGGHWLALAFIDSANVTVNHNTWATGENSAALSGAGVGPAPTSGAPRRMSPHRSAPPQLWWAAPTPRGPGWKLVDDSERTFNAIYLIATHA
jgi:hemolysin activation/secretion protein